MGVRTKVVVLVSALAVASWPGAPGARAAAADSEIVYSVFDEDSGQTGIYRAGADGSNLRTIAPMGEALGFQTISPDGVFAVATGDESLDLLRLDGTARTTLVPGYGSAAWSADSSKLLVVSGDLGGEVVQAVGLDGSSQPMTTGEALGGGSLSPRAWSPDGSVGVVWGWRPGGVQTNWKVGLDGSVTEWPSLQALAASPTGGIVLAVEETDTGLDLVFLDDALANPDLVGQLPSGWVDDASWTRDGAQVTFLHTSLAGEQTIWTLDASGEVVRTWEDLPLEGTGLAYEALSPSPDGSMLAWYARTLTQQFSFEGVYVHDVVRDRTCQVVGVYDEMGAGLRPQFSPDGSLLVVHNGAGVGVIPLQTPGSPLQRPDLGSGLVQFHGFVPEQPAVVEAEPCARPRVERHVRMEWSRSKGAWRLAAYVFGNEPRCVNEVPVRFQRKTASGWRTFADRSTDSRHTAVTRVTRPGRYRALAPKVVRSDHTCLRTVSDPLRLRR